MTPDAEHEEASRPRFKVGLTGGLASGKSTVSRLFEDLGVTVIDADVVAREVVGTGRPGLDDIVEAFGENILEAGGTLNRSALRELVFSDEVKRKRLESILHPRIRHEMRMQGAKAHGPYVMLSIPLLLESKQQETVDRVLVVDVPRGLQVKRALQRDGSSRVTINGILSAQIGRDERLLLADDVIDNSHGTHTLIGPVKELHARYSAMARSLPVERNY